MSIVGGPGSSASTGWQCVAAWTTIPDATPNATMWLFAADAAAASDLARDLRAFAAEHTDGGFLLDFADDARGCVSP